MKNKSSNSPSIDNNSSSKSFFNLYGDIEKADKAIKGAFIAGIVITALSALLIFMLALMKAGGISLPHLSYFHYLVIVASAGLTYGIYKKNLIAAILLLVLFISDKILLMSYSLTTLVIAIPIFIALVYFLFQGIRGTLAYRSLTSQGKTSDKIKESLSKATEKPNKKASFVESFILLSVLVLASVVAYRIFDWCLQLSVNPGKEWVFILGVVCAIIVLVITIVALYKPLKKELGKLPFVISTVILIALSTSLTTFIPQSGTVPNQPIEYYTRAFGVYLGKLIILLDIHQVFHSWWFIGFFVLIIINLFIILSKRKLNRKTLGFYVTHVSLIVIFTSVWFNYFFSFSGIIQLREGMKSNKVELFTESQKKMESFYKIWRFFSDNKDLKNTDKKLDFYIQLDQFDTRKYDAYYKIYVKKFPKKLPKTLGVRFVNKRVLPQLPPQMQKAFLTVYKKEDQLSTKAILSMISSVGLTYMSTYKKVGKHYVFQRSADEKAYKMVRYVFKSMGYKGKDITADPVKIGKEKKIFTTRLKYTVKRYLKNYYTQFVVIPNSIEIPLFENSILPKIEKTEDQEFLKTAYEKSDKSYTLKLSIKDMKDKKDQKNKTHLSQIFSPFDQTVLAKQTQANDPVLGIFLREGPNKNEWILKSKDRRNSFSPPNIPLEIKFLWDAPEKEIQSFFQANSKTRSIPHKLALMKGDKKVREIELTPNKDVDIPGSDYKIKVADFYHDFKISGSSGNPTDGPNLNGNPAISLIISKKHANGEKALKMLLFSDERLHKQYGAIQPNIKTAEKKLGYKLKYVFKKENDKHNRMLILGKKQMIYRSIVDTPLKTEKIRYDIPYRINNKTTLYLNYLYPDSQQTGAVLSSRENIPDYINPDVFENEIIKKLKDKSYEKILKDSFVQKMKVYLLKSKYFMDKKRRKEIAKAFMNAGYQAPPANPLAIVKVSKGSKELATVNLIAKSSYSTYIVPESNYTMILESRKDRETKYWKSHLSVLEAKNKEATQFDVKHQEIIKVNQFMYYKGYRFYQTDATEKDPSYSGIGVTIEPGLPIIYGSFISLALGVLLMFYINPGKKKTN